MNSKDIQLSKSLSWLLRHGAVKEGFDLSPEGYINVNKILQHKSFACYTVSDIERVVRNNEKQRFQLRQNPLTGSVEIKANQGHSIEITDAELTPILTPKYQTVVHGTFVKCWPQIKQTGLNRMRRRHIHLAKGTHTDKTISGLRNNAQIHIYVNLAKALDDGIKFYESDNGVILTPGNEKGYLETKYFDRVVEVATGMEVPVARVPSRPTFTRPPFGPAAPPPPPRAAPAPHRPATARAPLSAPAPRPAPPATPGPAPPIGREVRSAEAQRRNQDEIIPTAILVTGYPPYTKAQDLAHAFCRFGAVRLQDAWVTAAGACLEFGEPAHAQAAIRASRAVNVYGAFLTVRPCTTRSRPQRAPAPPRRERRVTQGTNFKGTIVEPANIPLQGGFHQQLDALLCAVRLTQPEIERLATLYRDLEYVLSDVWPGCRAIPFGSVTTGLGVKSSDADCFVSLPAGSPRATAVARAKRALQAHPHTFDELLAIPRANTPIVKFLHIPTGVYCDLSFKTALGSQNSKLISFLLFSDPRLIPIAVVIKYWARVHELTGTGKLTNYALTMLIIFYFQQPPISILPPVEWLQRDRNYDFYVDYWNTGFMSDIRRIPRPTNTSSIAELLGGFFEYYAKFDFEQYCVCPFLGRTVKKDDFRDLSLLPEEFSRYKTNVYSGASLPMRFMTSMCVQDPFEQCHNVASSVSSRLAADVCAYFKFAAESYAKEKLKDFSGFLTTILLEKPVLPRTKKGGSEFRARLPPGLLGNIASADWKSVVRDVAFQVFETILRVKLTKIEEEQPEAGRSEKDFAKAGKSSKTDGTPKRGRSPGSSKAGKLPKAEENVLTEKIAKENSPKPRRKSVDSQRQENKADENTKPRNKNKPERMSSPGRETATSEVTAKFKETIIEAASKLANVEKEQAETSKVEKKERASSPEKGKLKAEVTKGDKVVKPGGITRKEKEKYMGEITKAIWKRKLFSKLYSVMGLKFLDRETMITDEIMKVDKNVFDVKFQVVVTFNNAPRSAVVSIRHVSGELNHFKEFGKFFNNNFQHWFVILYKPYCKKNNKNPTDQKTMPAANDEEAATRELNEAMKKDAEDKSDSDSDSDFSYEDERIDPNTVFEREDSAKYDSDKINKNKTNSTVKKQGESDKAKNKIETDNKVPLSDEKHDKDVIPSDKSPRKGKNKHNNKINDQVVDHINDVVQSLNLSEKSPLRSNKNKHSDMGDQNKSLNASNNSPQNAKTKREIDKSKTRHRNRKLKDKKQSAPTETGNVTSAMATGPIH